MVDHEIFSTDDTGSWGFTFLLRKLLFPFLLSILLHIYIYTSYMYIHMHIYIYLHYINDTLHISHRFIEHTHISTFRTLAKTLRSPELRGLDLCEPELRRQRRFWSGGSMGKTRDFYGISMGKRWENYGESQFEGGFLCDFYGNFGISMWFLWDFDFFGTSMGSLMKISPGLPWFSEEQRPRCRGFSETPWQRWHRCGSMRNYMVFFLGKHWEHFGISG